MKSAHKITKASFVGCSKVCHFKERKCVVPISVGQPYHEGKKLSAIVDLINAVFGSCVIVVCDSLQRHTLHMFRGVIDLSNVCDYAKHLGDEWLQRNYNIIKKLSIPYKISRWDDWLAHPEHDLLQQKVKSSYEHDSKFRSALLRSAGSFVKRVENRQGDDYVSRELLLESLAYFKEECAVMPLWKHEDIDYEIYPGDRPDALVIAHEYFVGQSNTLEWLKLRFRSKTKNIISE